MNRRTFLGGAAAAGVLALAGCSGGSGESASSDLRVTDFRVEAGDDGRLVVVAVVANTGSERRDGTLYVNVRANGTPSTRVRSVTVEAAGTAEVRAEFDVARSAFDANGDLSFDWGDADG